MAWIKAKNKAALTADETLNRRKAKKKAALSEEKTLN